MEKVIFRLIYWASDGEKLEVIPSSSVLLFDPPTLNVAMKAGTINVVGLDLPRNEFT